MSRVLCFGFEPFPSVPASAAWDAVEALAAARSPLSGSPTPEILARELPLAFDEAPRRVRASIAKHLPDAVIIVATAPGRTTLAIERLAINLDDAPYPDNAGNSPQDRPVIADAPAGLWSTLPVREITQALNAAGIPAELSPFAGTSVSNHVFFALLAELAKWNVPAGLIHVPATPEMALGPDIPVLPTAQIAQGLGIAVDTVLPPAVADAPVTSPATSPIDPNREAVASAAVEERDAPLTPSTESLDTQPFLLPIAEPIYQETPVNQDAPAFAQAAATIEQPVDASNSPPSAGLTWDQILSGEESGENQ